MNLTEASNWEAGIYQIETEDLVQGGPGGVSNLQPQQLANRTLWLKNQLSLKAASDHNHDGRYVKLEDIVGLIPAGTVMAWASELAPTGYLPCEGAAISRTSYANLFAAIGIQYGDGDGETTFNLPDYRGQFLRGWDHGSGLDPDAAARTDRGDGTGGNAVGSKQADDFKSHRHGSKKANYSGGGSTTDPLWFDEDGVTPKVYTDYEGGNETRPKNVNVLYIIKY